MSRQVKGYLKKAEFEDGSIVYYVVTEDGRPIGLHLNEIADDNLVDKLVKADLVMCNYLNPHDQYSVINLKSQEDNTGE